MILALSKWFGHTRNKCGTPVNSDPSLKPPANCNLHKQRAPRKHHAAKIAGLLEANHSMQIPAAIHVENCVYLGYAY